MEQSTFSDLFDNVVSVDLPFSKSISNRALMCNALLNFSVKINGLSFADDTFVLAMMLNKFLTGATDFYAEEGGTSFRFMMAFLAANNGRYILRAAPSLLARPHDDLVVALKNMGADIRKIEDGYLIVAKGLSGGIVNVDMSKSSQYVSALMLVSPMMNKPLNFVIPEHRVSFGYVDMTLKVIKSFGINVSFLNKSIVVNNSISEGIATYEVEKDWSAASFWYALVAITRNKKLLLKGLLKDSIQPDSIARKIFFKLGVHSKLTKEGIIIFVKDDNVEFVKEDLSQCPDLLLPILVSCVACNCKARLLGLSALRYKESDRLNLTVENLKKCGFNVSIVKNSEIIFEPLVKEVFDDEDYDNLQKNELSVCDMDYCPEPLKEKVEIDNGNDHRMVMAFSVLAQKYPNIVVGDTTCVAKSYPNFIEELNRVESN